jgi:hypothetical protein
VPRVREDTEAELRLDEDVEERADPVREDAVRPDAAWALPAACPPALAGAAVPQVSQYPSASMWPSQPGSRHAITAVSSSPKRSSA